MSSGIATSSCTNNRCANRPTYATSIDVDELISRVTEKSSMCEYGVFTLLSMPQLIANKLESGVAGNPPAGAGGSNPAGMSLMPWNRGAVVVLKNPGGFEMLLDNPNDPDVSNSFTTAAPKWS